MNPIAKNKTPSVEDCVAFLDPFKGKELTDLATAKFKAKDVPWCQAFVQMGALDPNRAASFASPGQNVLEHQENAMLAVLSLLDNTKMDNLQSPKIATLDVPEALLSSLEDAFQQTLPALGARTELTQSWLHLACALNKPDWIERLPYSSVAFEATSMNLKRMAPNLYDHAFPDPEDTFESWLDEEGVDFIRVSPLVTAYAHSHTACVDALVQRGVPWTSVALDVYGDGQESCSIAFDELMGHMEPSCTLDAHRHVLSSLQKEGRHIVEMSNHLPTCSFNEHAYTGVWMDLNMIPKSLNFVLVELAIKHGLPDQVAEKTKALDPEQLKKVMDPVNFQSWAANVHPTPSIPVQTRKIEAINALVQEVLTTPDGLKMVIGSPDPKTTLQPLGDVLRMAKPELIEKLIDLGVDLFSTPQGAQKSPLDHLQQTSPHQVAVVHAILAKMKTQDILDAIHPKANP